MKSKKERLDEVMQSLNKLHEIGIDMNHTSIIEFKKICNEFVTEEVNASGTLPLWEYHHNLEYKFSLKVPSVVKMTHLKNTNYDNKTES